MDLFEAIRERRSVRKFSGKPIEKEKLIQVLNAARLAPSGKNRQTWKFIVVRDAAKKAELAAITRGQHWIEKADVIIAAVATDTKIITGSGEPAHRIDISIAVDHMTLAAHALGLGSCWIGAFDQRGAERVLGVPPEMEVIVLLPIGYPEGIAKDPGRKPLSEIISVDSFDGPQEV